MLFNVLYGKILKIMLPLLSVLKQRLSIVLKKKGAQAKHSYFHYLSKQHSYSKFIWICDEMPT